jgi:peptidoglycan-associated lipoprotein
MTSFGVLGVLAAAALASAGCAKKKPQDLPPPPISGAEPESSGYEDGSVIDAELESLRSDFVAQAGSDTVYFATDSYALDDEDRRILDAQAQWLLRHPDIHVTVEGHCDERGTREYNLALGDRRATAAKNYMAARGISTSRMSTISWGKERPVDLGSSEAAWAQNRRAVSLVVRR